MLSSVMVFVPSRGFLFFYIQNGKNEKKEEKMCFRPLTGISLFLYIGNIQQRYLCNVFVPSRGFLFFYPISYSPYKSRVIFIICGANIFKPRECYF